MKTQVNDNCIGCELCVNLCPDVFEMQEDGLAHATVDDVPADVQDDVRSAADQCPVDAIEISE